MAKDTLNILDKDDPMFSERVSFSSLKSKSGSRRSSKSTQPIMDGQSIKNLIQSTKKAEQQKT